MKHLAYILIIALALTSCKSAKPTVQTNRTVTDSTVTTVRHELKRDTFIIEGDTLKFKIPILDITEEPIIRRSETGRITAMLSKIDNELQVECFVDELLKVIETQNTIIETLTKRLEATDTTITITEYKTPWYSKALSVVGIAALLFGAALVIKPFLKPF